MPGETSTNHVEWKLLFSLLADVTEVPRFANSEIYTGCAQITTTAMKASEIGEIT